MAASDNVLKMQFKIYLHFEVIENMWHGIYS